MVNVTNCHKERICILESTDKNIYQLRSSAVSFPRKHCINKFCLLIIIIIIIFPEKCHMRDSGDNGGYRPIPHIMSASVFMKSEALYKYLYRIQYKNVTLSSKITDNI